MGRNDNGIWSVKNWNQLKSEAGFRVSLPRPWIYIYTCRMAFTRARAPIHRCTSKSMHRVPLVDIHWLLLHLQARFPFVFSLTYQRPTTRLIPLLLRFRLPVLVQPSSSLLLFPYPLEETNWLPIREILLVARVASIFLACYPACPVMWTITESVPG